MADLLQKAGPSVAPIDGLEKNKLQAPTETYKPYILVYTDKKCSLYNAHTQFLFSHHEHTHKQMFKGPFSMTAHCPGQPVPER